MGVKQIEGVAGLEHHFVGGQGQVQVHQALGFAFEVVELLEKLLAVAGLEVVDGLFDFVLMEDVAVGELAFRAVRIGPRREDEVEDVVAVLQIHRQALETVRDFAGDRLAFKAAHLLEVRELRHFHAVHPDFPAETPGAERRVFPVVLDEADVVDFRVDAERAKAAQIEVDDVRRSRLQHDLELVVLVEAVRIFTIAGVLRTTRGLNVGGTPGFRPQSPQKGRSMGRAGTDFQVDRLQQSTALAVPIFLQAQDYFLKGNHSLCRRFLSAPVDSKNEGALPFLTETGAQGFNYKPFTLPARILAVPKRTSTAQSARTSDASSAGQLPSLT